MFAFVAKHRGMRHEALAAEVRKSFLDSDRTYGARRVWHDVLAAGLSCGLHAIERLTRLNALRARPRRRRLPVDTGTRPVTELPANILDRQFDAPAPNRKWVADFTYIWTAEGWLYVAVVTTTRLTIGHPFARKRREPTKRELRTIFSACPFSAITSRKAWCS